MNYGILYYWYESDVREPNVNIFVEELKNYEKYYEKNESNLDLCEPNDMDHLLDTYNKRKSQFENNETYDEIYYLILDMNDKEGMDKKIEDVENYDNFISWIDKSHYPQINNLFFGTGQFKKELNKHTKK